MVGRTPGTAETRAEAAAWLARLQSEERDPSDEAAFRDWLAQSPDHQEAFDSLTSAWDLAGGLAADYPAEAYRPSVRRAPTRRTWMAMAASVAIVAVGAGAWPLLDRGQIYTTERGETLRVAAPDGSSILLDSDSRLRIHMTGSRRDLFLERGRAHFEVVKDAHRPFVVAAGEREIVSIGTVFDVSQDAASTSVLLVEGLISVRPTAESGVKDQPRLVQPGERLTFDPDGRVRSDRPDVQKLVAWQSGEAIFNDDSLAVAAAELNRYSRRPLVIADSRAGAMRVSGVFRAGATEAFATSVSELLPIEVRVEETRIVIGSRGPSA